MDVIHHVAELRQRLAEWRRAGERIALVPTMGNLHAGHLRLVAEGHRHATRVVASVFVNPLQFGANEDFGRYPRTLDADRRQLLAAGCELLFAPDVPEVYPHGRDALTMIHVPEVTADLEGAFRPGHFDGVATVVNILFNLVQPDCALFGQKDYQQLQVIRRMVRDLRMPIEVIGVPTTRAEDGLALSSRNQYLSSEERAQAGTVYRVLMAVAEGLRAGRRDFPELAAECAQVLVDSGFKPQYLDIRRTDLGMPAAADRSLVILVAAYLGKTRLIDNLQIELPTV